ncbi:MAG: NUDIX domain-containing protein [bacterium]|nr:NUDIX domain-containing protein [bacterium]
MDKNESYHQCAVREIEEELKIELDYEDFSHPIVVHCVNKKDQSIFLGRYILCEKWEGIPINNEPDKCSKIARYRIDNLPQNTPFCTQKALE